MNQLHPGEWGRPPFLTRFASWLTNPRGLARRSRLRAAVAGKTVLVTGASYGIGAATARLLAAAGARVLLVARSRDQLESVSAEIASQGGLAEVYPTDLTKTDAVADLAQRLLQTHGFIDIVVNNAGKSIRRSLALSYDRFHDFERTIGVNYLGPVRLILALLPEMRRRGCGQIVNISTFGVRVTPGPRWGAYVASKTAFDAWFRSIGIEVRSDGVATSTIYMPLVYTRMSAPTPSLRKLPGLSPDQAASLVARAIVRRPNSIAPWWLWPCEVLSVLFRQPIEWGLGVFFRRSTDSPSAAGTPTASVISDNSIGLRRAFRKAGLFPLSVPNAVRMARAVLVQGGRPSSLCRMTSQRVPNQLAVIDQDDSVTYGMLQNRIERLAAALQKQFRLGPGHAVGVMCRNHRKFVEAMLAGSALGSDVVLLNTEFPGPQMRQVLDSLQLACMIHDGEFAAVIAQSGYSGVRVSSEARSDGPSVDALIENEHGRLAGVRRCGRIVILTSGTTGVPKGAARRPRFRAQSGPLATLLAKVPFRAGGVILIAPPLFHGMGFAYLNLALVLGATVVVRRRFEPEQVLADIAQRKVEVMIAVPTMLKRLLDVPADVRENYDLSSLKAVLCSGAALGVDLASRFLQTFGPCLYNLYGSSELGFGAIAAPDDLVAAPGTVGYPPVGTQVRILDGLGKELPVGQTGRVFLKTGLAFKGYVGGGGKEVIDDYLNTGDLGRLDAAGRLFIDGRADEMIISGGENVFPTEVEDVLCSHPAIAEAAVIGMPDEQFGQRLKAFVVARTGEQIGADELRSFLKDRIARFKAPREFVFVPELPRNALGKVLKKTLSGSS